MRFGVTLLAGAGLVLACPAAINAQSQGASGTTVVVSASAAVDPSVPHSRVRNRAVNRALRQAVEQAAGVILISETEVEDLALATDRILSRASGYVEAYEVLAEETVDSVLKVTVEAQVDRGNLSEDLVALGLIRDRIGLPSIASRPVSGADGAKSAVSEAVSSWARENHLDVARDWREADVALEYAAQTESAGQVSGFWSVTGSVSIEAVDTRGRVIASATGSAREADVTKENAAVKALRNASEAALARLFDELVESWRVMAYDQNEVRISLVEVPSYDAVISFTQQVGEELPSTERVLISAVDLHRDRATVRWIGLASATEIAERIQARHFGRYVGTVRAVDGETIVVRFVLRR